MPSGNAPGYRNYSTGAPSSIGIGYSWSATPVNQTIHVRCLDFTTQNLTPENAHNRAHGIQLRCLSE
ncbi:hypothetical protein [uncultured Rikenella sp.]|uniref:hypothetical protein n=1 Tax=uncultured Rikenella sp. TaxID=368003 RepID=UPI00272B210C|nr:hypothetical protein [uncultured Rikenella sp.]